MTMIQKKLFTTRFNSPLFGFALLLCCSILFFACEKDDTTTGEEETITNEEAVDLVEGALMSQSQGLAKTAEDAANITDEYLEGDNASFCGLAFDTTLNWGINTNRITGSYEVAWGYTLNCDNFNLPKSIDFVSSVAGNYETQRLLSDDSASSNLLLDDIFFGSAYTLSGSYTRNGTQTSKVRNENTFNSNTQIDITDIKVDKTTKRITSGAGTFLLTGSITGGSDFTIEGTIVFLGDGAATVTINGETFEIDLY